MIGKDLEKECNAVGCGRAASKDLGVMRYCDQHHAQRSKPGWLQLDDDPKGVVHPRHYNRGIECWDYIESHGLNFIAGNVIKYVTRYRFKDGLKDLRKARQYLEKLISIEEAKVANTPTPRLAADYRHSWAQDTAGYQCVHCGQRALTRHEGLCDAHDWEPSATGETRCARCSVAWHASLDGSRCMGVAP